jgi:hypothetical protein
MSTLDDRRARSINAPQEFLDWVDEARCKTIRAELERRGEWTASLFRDRGSPCPRCGGTDRFSVNVRKDVFVCRGCGGGGRGAIDFVMWRDGCDLKIACETILGRSWRGQKTVAKYAPAADEDERRRRAEGIEAKRKADTAEENTSRLGALKIWNDSVAEDGDGLVARYLREERKTQLSPDDWKYLSPRVIRFHPRCPFGKGEDGGQLYHPAMICIFRNVITDAEQAVSRVALTPDGKKIGRLMLGPRRASSFSGLAAIKLSPDEDVEQGVVAAEGSETGLAAWVAGYRPTWALGDAGAIGEFPVLAGLDGITILAEKDKPGVTASADAIRECGARWARAGREVIVWRSELGDFNDALREADR